MRRGPVHHFEGSHYFLMLACQSVRQSESGSLHFSTSWPNVTCEQCLAKKPKTAAEREALAKLQTLA